MKNLMYLPYKIKFIPGECRLPGTSGLGVLLGYRLATGTSAVGVARLG